MKLEESEQVNCWFYLKEYDYSGNLVKNVYEDFI